MPHETQAVLVYSSRKLLLLGMAVSSECRFAGVQGTDAA